MNSPLTQNIAESKTSVLDLNHCFKRYIKELMANIYS